MTNSKKKPGPAAGDVYEDGNRYETNRQLRLTSAAPDDYLGRPRFNAETIRNDGRPHLVGRTTVIGAHMLQAGFRKIDD